MATTGVQYTTNWRGERVPVTSTTPATATKPVASVTPVKATTAPAIVAPPPAGLTAASPQTNIAGATGAGAAGLDAVSTQTNPLGVPNWTPGGAGINGGSTDPLTGYLARFGYTPIGAADLYNNPQPLAQDMLGQLGINNPGMSQQMADMFDSLLASQFVTNRGMDATDNETLNYIAHMMGQAATPGGRFIDPAYYMQTLFGAAGDENPLGTYMQYDAQGNPLTPAQQTQTVNALASQGLVGLNPYSQRAMSGALGNYGNQYQASTMKGDPLAANYAAYIAQQTPFQNWF
jgi:hypothetical protein